jgi:outer membrane biosynthesis protein TonB
MQQYIRPSRTLLALLCATTVAATACGEKKTDAALTADSALGRDLALAARDTTVQPQLKDVPAAPPAAVPTPAPARPKPKPAAPKPTPAAPPVATAPAPTPAPKPAEPVTGTVAAGTTLSFTNNSKVCTNTNKVGDKFTADLSESVPASNGVSIPAGAVGTFEITEAKTAKNSNDQTYLKVRLISVQYGGRTYPVESTLQTASTTRIRGASKSTDAKKVAGGAIIGAIAGQIIGKDTKGTVIGAAAGAAAGTAAAAATADFETCLNGGGSVVVKLDSPATVRLASN